MRTYRRTDVTERFWVKVDRRGDFECWPWTGHLEKGYGRLTLDPVNLDKAFAHRFCYELLVGPIPDGMTLDHLCHTTSTCPGGPDCLHRRCVNPLHLDPVTLVENVMRGQGITAQNARKTHCKRGHELPAPDKSGKRVCHPCGLAKKRRYNAKLKAARTEARERGEKVWGGRPGFRGSVAGPRDQPAVAATVRKLERKDTTT
jgi:hypothetical protein